jgi:hypothetical protein
MSLDDLITHLRTATEDDVAAALDDAAIVAPLCTPLEMLEFFHSMVDVLTGALTEPVLEDLAQIIRAAGNDTLQ